MTYPNISLKKIDHPAFRCFLHRHVKGSGAIPKADSLRLWYLPTLQEAYTEELQKIINEADGIILTADESGDNVTDRMVLNLIFTPSKLVKRLQRWPL